MSIAILFPQTGCVNPAMKRYTAEDIDFLIKNYPTHGGEYCASHLNRPRTDLSSICQRLGLKVNQDVRHTNLCALRSRYKDFSKYKVNPKAFFEPSSPEAIYLLGLLWADGHNQHDKGRLSFECLRPDFENVKPVFLRTGNWNIRYRQRSNRKAIGTADTSNRPLTDFLKRFNYSTKNQDATILSLIPDNLLHYWFRGLSDGDGCFYFNPKKKTAQYSVHGPVDQDWSFMEQILNRLDIKHRIKIECRSVNGASHANSTIRFCRKSDVIKFGDFIYQNFEIDKIGFTRKYEKLNVIKSSVTPERKSLLAHS